MPRDRDVQAFDERAASYESGRHGQLHQEISDRVVKLALARVPAPRSVLDVGCGTGYVLRQLAARLPQASEFLGMDAAPTMIEVARAAAGDERLAFVQGTAERLPAGDGVYDLVLSTTSFDHWTDQAAGIRECARALAPGGTDRPVLSPAVAHVAGPAPRQGPHPGPGGQADHRGRPARAALASLLCGHHPERDRRAVEAAGPRVSGELTG